MFMSMRIEEIEIICVYYIVSFTSTFVSMRIEEIVIGNDIVNLSIKIGQVGDVINPNCRATAVAPAAHLM